ncbi:MAG TPA: serine hydrolase domain-containing protein [Candidatus Saccharimonadales bacterium]|nr:serine hydrolase domain-containing protein [Candidatus Saccharimonadales bacterium]
MIHRRPRVAFAALLAALSLSGCAAENPVRQAVDRARPIVSEYFRRCGAPALQIAVGLDGRIVWSEAMGLADRERGLEATTQSRFRIASVSKLLTGTLVAELATRGTLDLDRPLGRYVPGIPAAWDPITARMLVSHTSGIPHYTDDQDTLDTTRYPTTRAALARFRDRPLVHPPGSAETYSSYAYTVLALAIEEATGSPFLDVMKTEVLDPLGMASTGPDRSDLVIPERTAFYQIAADGSAVEAPPVDLSGRWAGSGYLSTAEDLVRFGMAHTDSGSLPAAVRMMIAERQVLPDGSLTKEGFGWGPRQDWDGRAMLWGDGSTPGSRCGLLVYPKEGLVIAILTNARGVRLERGEFQTLARLFLAAHEGVAPAGIPSGMDGAWQGTVKAGAATMHVELTLDGAPGPVKGSVSFAGWRSLDIIDAFRLGSETWLVPLDRNGFLPIRVVASAGALEANVPRANFSVTLRRAAGKR